MNNGNYVLMKSECISTYQYNKRYHAYICKLIQGHYGHLRQPILPPDNPISFSGSVGAGRSPRRQMRRYLLCGERFVMSLATVAKTKNEMLPQYLSWILSRFRGKFAGKTTALTSFFFWHTHGFISFFKFSIDLASIFQFCRSINIFIAIIVYIIDYIQHKICLFTFLTKNKMADNHDVDLFLCSDHLIIWCCFIHTDHELFILSLYHNLCVMSHL